MFWSVCCASDEGTATSAVVVGDETQKEKAADSLEADPCVTDVQQTDGRDEMEPPLKSADIRNDDLVDEVIEVNDETDSDAASAPTDSRQLLPDVEPVAGKDNTDKAARRSKVTFASPVEQPEEKPEKEEQKPPKASFRRAPTAFVATPIEPEADVEETEATEEPKSEEPTEPAQSAEPVESAEPAASPEPAASAEPEVVIAEHPPEEPEDFPSTYYVEVEKSAGDQMGLSFDITNEKMPLVAMICQDSLIELWNSRAHRGVRVEVGHGLVEVNGMQSSGRAMVKKLQGTGTLNLCFRRPRERSVDLERREGEFGLKLKEMKHSDFGLLVVKVAGEAQAAGLKASEIILEANGVKTTPAQLYHVITQSSKLSLRCCSYDP